MQKTRCVIQKRTGQTQFKAILSTSHSGTHSCTPRGHRTVHSKMSVSYTHLDVYKRQSQDSADDDDKIDIFLIEADYALKYVDSDYVRCV